MDQIKVLLIEDNPADAALVEAMLDDQKRAAFDLEWKDTLSAGLKSLAEGKRTDVVLLDLMLPDSRGLESFIRVQSHSPAVPVVVMTGLDDEALAFSAVRQGAQDYLVKGQADATRLAIAIRYAIARRLGEERTFSLRELKQYDGAEGKPAYVAFQGKVYDVSHSRLWKRGAHVSRHFAGLDLTDSMAGAPHGVDVFAKFHIVGGLIREKPLGQRLAVKIEEWHLHPIFVHFSVAYSVGIPLVMGGFLLTSEPLFELGSYYLLLLGMVFSLLAAFSGLFSWRITYEGRMAGIFVRKLVFTAALLAVTTACYLWWVQDPGILVARSQWRYVFLVLAGSLVPITAVLGHDGGKIVFSLSKHMWG